MEKAGRAAMPAPFVWDGPPIDIEAGIRRPMRKGPAVARRALIQSIDSAQILPLRCWIIMKVSKVYSEICAHR